MNDFTIKRETGYATGADIDEIISQVAPAIQGYDPDLQLIACLSICFIMMNPHIEFETLQLGVAGASGWIADFVARHANLDFVPLKPEQMN